MNNREMFKAALNFEPLERPCHLEHGFWTETMERWRKEGLPESVRDSELFKPSIGDAFSHFGILKPGYLRPETNMYPSIPYEVLEETDNYIIHRNWNGVVYKVNKLNPTLPQTLDYTIKTREDYHKYRERLTGDFDARYGNEMDKIIAEYNEQNDYAAVCTHLDGFFAYPREILGVEGTLYTYYDDPELMHEMIDDRVEFYLKLYDMILRNIKPDFAFIWEDMCFKNGPLVSPDIFREFMMPAYKRIISLFHDYNVKNIVVDSDGDVIRLIPLWMEAGVTGLLPFEVQAGMDVVRLGEMFPKLQIFGGINKIEIAKGREHIDRELDRVIPFMLKRSGYIATLDHWVPPDISYDDFCYYVEKLGSYRT